MHADFTWRQHTKSKYGDHILEVGRETFHQRSDPLHEKVVDRYNVEHDVWIVPVPFYSVLYQ